MGRNEKMDLPVMPNLLVSAVLNGILEQGGCETAGRNKDPLYTSTHSG